MKNEWKEQTTDEKIVDSYRKMSHENEIEKERDGDIEKQWISLRLSVFIEIRFFGFATNSNIVKNMMSLRAILINVSVMGEISENYLNELVKSGC